MQNSSETLSDRIRIKMKETGVKQAHLAKKLGVSPQHLNKILKTQEKSQYMPQITDFLGMDESLHDTLSERVKEKIKESGIKQAHLANKLGVSPQHLNKILTKGQRKNQYMPQIAKILGMDDPEKPPVKTIPILTENDFKSLLVNVALFEEINSAVAKSWPSFIREDYYFFGYELTENSSSKLIKDDLLIFSSCIPLNITGRIGIALIKETSSIFIGPLKNNKKTITIYNEHDCIEFKSGDLLLGIGIHLERNIEKGH